MSRIEPATAAYAEAMAAVHAASFPAGEQWGPDAITLQLGQPGAFGFVAPIGGFILVRVAADESEILTLAVDPAARGAGLGRALIEHAMSEVVRRGAAMMYLEVSELNAAARALYAACGFVEIARRRRYYGGRTDALVMRASISGGSRAG